jgi:hypothetical protein
MSREYDKNRQNRTPDKPPAPPAENALEASTKKNTEGAHTTPKVTQAIGSSGTSFMGEGLGLRLLAGYQLHRAAYSLIYCERGLLFASKE